MPRRAAGTTCGVVYAGIASSMPNNPANPMQLDVKTLYLLNIVVALVTASVSFFSWFYHRDMPGLRGWAIGLSLGAAGTVLLSLRTPTSPIILIIAGNALIVAGYATVWMSVRRFNDGSLDLRYITLPVGLFVVIFTIASLAGADVRGRVAMVSTAIGALSLLAGREVFNARKQEPLGSRLPTSLAFAFIAVAMIVRAIFSLLGDVPARIPHSMIRHRVRRCSSIRSAWWR